MIVFNVNIQQERLDTYVWKSVEYGVQRQNHRWADNETANSEPQSRAVPLNGTKCLPRCIQQLTSYTTTDILEDIIPQYFMLL